MLQLMAQSKRIRILESKHSNYQAFSWRSGRSNNKKRQIREEYMVVSASGALQSDLEW